MMTKLIVKILNPKWVVYTTNDDPKPELGLMVWGVIFCLYKGYVWVPSKDSIVYIRPPEKREFGESLHPVE